LFSHLRLRFPFLSDVPRTPGFYGTIDAEKATQYLTGSPKGTYLLRFSSQPNAYAISYIADVS